MRWRRWHVQQLYKLRKWKEPRAELHEPNISVRDRIVGGHNVDRLVRGMQGNPGAFSHGDRVSAPLIVMDNWPYRIRRWRPTKRKP